MQIFRIKKQYYASCKYKKMQFDICVPYYYPSATYLSVNQLVQMIKIVHLPFFLAKHCIDILYQVPDGQ